MLKVEDILNAAEKLKGVAYHTALTKYHMYSELFDCQLYFKREDLQVVRSYKLRGAYNFLVNKTAEELAAGVVCASAGNHAQGVAYSCHKLGVKGRIFMPNTTPRQKVNQVKMFGRNDVEVILAGDSFDDAYEQAMISCEKDKMLFVHPFNDEQIMAGQGTVAKEILDDFNDKIDYVFVPVGGGGLSAGMCTYFKKVSPGTKIIGVEPEGAPAMKRSLEAGKVVQLDKMDKFVDGAAVRKVGEKNFEICKELLDDVVLVPEGKICTWILKLYTEEAIVVEPAGALSVAALDFYREKIQNKNVVCIISGSNNDIERMQEIKERSMIYDGLKHYFIINFPQRAGALREFVNEILGPDDDITRFEYAKKSIKEAGPAVVGIELTDPGDFNSLISRMETKKINYTYLNKDPDLFNYFI